MTDYRQITVTMDRESAEAFVRRRGDQTAYYDAKAKVEHAFVAALDQTPSGEECDCVRWADPSWPGCPIHGTHGPCPTQPSGEDGEGEERGPKYPPAERLVESLRWAVGFIDRLGKFGPKAHEYPDGEDGEHDWTEWASAHDWLKDAEMATHSHDPALPRHVMNTPGARAAGEDPRTVASELKGTDQEPPPMISTIDQLAEWLLRFQARSQMAVEPDWDTFTDRDKAWYRKAAHDLRLQLHLDWAEPLAGKEQR